MTGPARAVLDRADPRTFEKKFFFITYMLMWPEAYIFICSELNNNMGLGLDEKIHDFDLTFDMKFFIYGGFG